MARKGIEDFFEVAKELLLFCSPYVMLVWIKRCKAWHFFFDLHIGSSLMKTGPLVISRLDNNLLHLLVTPKTIIK